MLGILARVYILGMTRWVFHLGPACRHSCLVFSCLALSLCFLLFFCFIVDVFKSTMWSNLQATVPSDDHHLGVLAYSLLDVTSAGRASSTTTKYSMIYARWKCWAHHHNLPAFPAFRYEFTLYLCHLMADAKTVSPIESAVHGIAIVHHLAREQSPSEIRESHLDSGL